MKIMRTSLILVLAVAAIGIGLVAGLALRQIRAGGELTSIEAATALRSSTAFTTREGSPVGRELVEVVLVRRIGRTSTEVEFTWRDTPSATGSSDGVRTSMALFRNMDGKQWVLTSLYKVH